MSGVRSFILSSPSPPQPSKAQKRDQKSGGDLHHFLPHPAKSYRYRSAKEERRGRFTHPNHSWELGPNENTNGLIRQYFSEKTNFSTINRKDVKEVQDNLSRRSRKCLDFQIPNDISSYSPNCASGLNPPGKKLVLRNP